GVNNYQHPNDNVEVKQVPAKHCRKNNSGRKNGNSAGDAALYQKKNGGKGTCFFIETAFKIFVCGVNFQFVVYGNKNHTDNYHCNGKPKIELYKPHAVVKSLSGSGKKGNGACLCCHDAQPDCPPICTIPAFKIIAHVSLLPSLPRSVNHDKNQGSY